MVFSEESQHPLLPNIVISLVQNLSLASQFCSVLPFVISPGHFASHYCSAVCFGARLSALPAQKD